MAAEARATVAQQASGRGESLKALSLMLGRNAAYLQQFVRRGSPRVLDSRDRRLLADHFGIDEALLGGTAQDRSQGRSLRLPVLDIQASAGPGTVVGDEVMVGAGTIDGALARQLGLKQGRASILGVRGDSMAPGLLAGDQIVVDETDRLPPAGGGIYVIRIDDAVLVKRVARRGGRLVVSSDNPAAPAVAAGAIAVLGRVVWQMRRPR